jgi:hypothetical protein
MATILTGRSLTLTIDGDTYTGQVTSALTETTANQITVETLTGREYKTIDNSSTLTIDLIQDWGAVGSICEGLKSAYDSAPDTSLAFTLSGNGASATGNIFPLAPAFGGNSTDVLTTSITFVVDGDVTVA